MEQPKTRNIQKAQDNIRKVLSELGIIGEVVTVSPARTTEELVEMGISKNYSTIVAVGTDAHINKIATYIKNSHIVLGIIPIDGSPLLYQMIGASDIKELCELLRFRKLKEVSMGAIEPNKYFLTQVEIQSPVSANVKITIINPGSDSYIAETSMSEIIISKNLYVFVTDKHKDKNLIKNTFNWMIGKKNSVVDQSILRGKKIKIETDEPIPVTLDGVIIAKTPIVATLYQRALKIISKPARIVIEEKERNNEETKH